MTPTVEKFIVVDDYNDYGLKNQHIPRCVWVTNYTWYNENEYEIDRWLLKHGCIMPGMIIKFPSEEALTLFLLRWQ
jgi:hypothetical protein